MLPGMWQKRTEVRIWFYFVYPNTSRWTNPLKILWWNLFYLFIAFSKKDFFVAFYDITAFFSDLKRVVDM